MSSLPYLTEIDYQTPEFGEHYDELPLWSAPFGLMLLEQVSLRANSTILDVGAGTGFLSVELAQRCGAGATIIAVDPWEAGIARLRRKLQHLGLSNVRTLVQDAAALDLPEASVDLIVSNLGINNFDDPITALRACCRVAKPGASLFLTTNLVGHMAEFYEVYRHVLVDLELASQLAALDRHIAHRATMESVRSQLEQAGFSLVNATTRTFHERYLDGSALLRHYFIRLGFMPGWKEIVAPEIRDAVFSSLEKQLNMLAAEQGELSLTIPAACIEARKAAK